MSGEIYNEAFYTEEAKVSLRCANLIVPLVQKMFNATTVLDVGCGVGAFLRVFREQGAKEILGMDGDYVPREKLLVPQEEFRPTDLSKPFSAGKKYDLTVCLEVGEHLDAPVADTFVQSLCAHSDVIVFSAAIPVQLGDHHVNEQWQSYWVEKFRQCGFYCFDVIRPKIWTNNMIEVFYKQNMLVFANEAGIARFPNTFNMEEAYKDPKSFDLVHPDLYIARVGTAQHLGAFFQQMAAAGKPFRIVKRPDGGFSAEAA